MPIRHKEKSHWKDPIDMLKDIIANCAGKFVNSFFALDEARQRRYLPYAPKFIRAKYRRRQGQSQRLA